MSGLAIQGNYSTSPMDYLSNLDSLSGTSELNGSGSSGAMSEQQIMQFLQELIALFQQALQNSNGGESDGGGSPAVGGSGGGAGGMPSLPASGLGGGVPSVDDGPTAATPAAAGTPSPASTPAVNDLASSTSPSNGYSATPQPAAAVPSATSNNAGGVPQAAAISGVNPASTQTVNTGTGSDKTFNVTNNTNRTESFTYSVQGANKGTITLAPGQTGAFTAGSGDIGARISPSDASGNTHPNEVLYEDGGADNGQATGVGNPDVSKVDGDKDFAGNDENMTVTLSDGRTAGDGDAIRAYMNPTDDAAAMGLAGDPSKTVNISMSDAAGNT
ncbi:hypothetical protein PQQ52_04020 [Paraburkholderia sediminicola]|uniref:hypothetical protein n=1 Tax=Paraburkholderia sediminicola TaxID=458836 RepID=UPI0038B7A61E